MSCVCSRGGAKRKLDANNLETCCVNFPPLDTRGSPANPCLVINCAPFQSALKVFWLILGPAGD